MLQTAFLGAPLAAGPAAALQRPSAARQCTTQAVSPGAATKRRAPGAWEAAAGAALPLPPPARLPAWPVLPAPQLFNFAKSAPTKKASAKPKYETVTVRPSFRIPTVLLGAPAAAAGVVAYAPHACC